MSEVISFAGASGAVMRNKKTAGGRCLSRPPAARGECVFATHGNRSYGVATVPSRFSSSSSWMMMRGVTIIIKLFVVRPMPTLRNSRLM